MVPLFTELEHKHGHTGMQLLLYCSLSQLEVCPNLNFLGRPVDPLCNQWGQPSEHTAAKLRKMIRTDTALFWVEEADVCHWLSTSWMSSSLFMHSWLGQVCSPVWSELVLRGSCVAKAQGSWSHNLYCLPSVEVWERAEWLTGSQNLQNSIANLLSD